MKSIFTDKEMMPAEVDIERSTAATYEYWTALREFVKESYPQAKEQWKYSSSGGWNFSVSDRKRAIIYLLPREGFFKAAMVFGDKSTGQVMDSPVSDIIKEELASARPYAEGRGIRIDIKDGSLIEDFKVLIKIKLGG